MVFKGSEEADLLREVSEEGNDEEYDKELFELNEKLIEIILKKSLEKNKVNEVIKRYLLREEIIDQVKEIGEAVKEGVEDIIDSNPKRKTKKTN